MNNFFDYLKTLPNFTVGVAMVIAAISYGLYRQSLMEKHGVITIARVDKFEGAEQGADLIVTVFYNDKEYKSTLNRFCRGCIGNYYYIKIIPTDPSTPTAELYEDKPVPYCYIGKVPIGGWQKIPEDTCK